MAKETMTETDALALCIASPMQSAGKFDADVAKQASDTLTKLFTAGKIDAETLGRIVARIGNHSAMRQWAEKQGIIERTAVAEDALAKAVKGLLAKSEVQA